MTRSVRARVAVVFGVLVLCLGAAASITILTEAGGFAERRWPIAILVIAALVVTIAGVAGFLLPLLRRVERLAAAAEAASGDHGVTLVGNHGSGDIGRIAGRFDAMLTELDTDRRRRSEAEERLRHHSSHDPLTGISNRAKLIDDLTAKLATGPDAADRGDRSGGGESIGLALIDVADFSLVNDLWGHGVGDEVLVAVASRLRRVMPDNDSVARWGADEFAVVLAGQDGLSRTQIVTRLRAALAEPFNTSAGAQPLATSVGVAEAVVGAQTAGELIARAEAALASEQQSNARSRSIDPQTARLVELALSDDRLEVFYQPLVEMHSPTGTQMVGAEALVRLRADDGSLRVPSDFLAEIMTTRYARDIDRRMAELVISQLVSWRNVGQVPDDFIVSLNLSPASLHDDGLARDLKRRCDDHRLPTACVVLEISEEAGELDQILSAELRQAGFSLSIDDLGLKRSNFDRLFNVGASYAKLHRRWLDDQVVLEALITICQRKGLTVVAEGVETMEQLELLFSLGVRLCQGYVISRPMSADSFETLLTSGRTVTGP